jgi:hypothetical protein
MNMNDYVVPVLIGFSWPLWATITRPTQTFTPPSARGKKLKQNAAP